MSRRGVIEATPRRGNVMRGDLTCVGGRLMRHDPQFDDPELETDIGECPDCGVEGCGEWNGDYPEPVSKNRQQAASKPVPAIWLPISTASKDGSSYLLKFRNDLQSIRPDLERWNNICFVGSHPGLAHDGFDIGWRFAAPVGMGGFPDEWFVGWRPLDDAPYPDAVKALVEAALRVAKSGGNTSDHMTACEKTMGDTHPCTCGAIALRAALRPFLKEGE